MTDPATRAGKDAVQVSSGEIRDGIWRLRIGGVLDWSNFAVVEEALHRLFDENHHRLVIDLSGTKFISSAGFGCFIEGVDVAMKFGGNIIFLNTPTAIKDIFNILGLSKILSFADSEAEALDRFRQNPA